ncbi:hypothetical protein EUX98_g7159 [Antrodiella citrinella]|uniref:HTH CENPB-type domain-containing protein n=1 Tax=Antrodiella citrinella TaxID=2447956 RepID=A0A4S4MPR0_9APHY|nr:hypothetical protein EUX98_g7159 [Antrodiella citrinella]
MSRSHDHRDYDPQQSPTYIQPRHPQASPQHQPYHPRDSPRDMSFGGEETDEGQVEAGPSSAPGDHYDSRGCQPRRPSLQRPFGEPTDGPSSAVIAEGPYSRPTGVFPLTPVSTSYTFYPSHSRSASGSGSGSGSIGNARSASPALSVASALTSVSSSASAQKYSEHHAHGTGHIVGGAPNVPRPKHRKQRLYNVDRKKICVYHRDHPNVKQEEIARLFGVERSTISKILKQKMKWLAVPEETPVLLARTRPTKFPILELRLEKWLRECHEQKIIFTDALIRDKAKEIARSMEWPDDKFKASSGWVENFKHRHGIRKGIWNGYGQKYSQAVANGGDPTSAIPYFDVDPTSHYINGKPAFAQPDDPVPPPPDMDHEMGMESDEEEEYPEDRQQGHGITLQPAWHPPPPPPPLSSAPHSQHTHHHVPAPPHSAPCEDHSPVHEVAPVADPHEPLPAPLPMPEPVAIPIHRDNDDTGEPEVAYVIPVLPTYRPDPGIPTVDEVEEAIDKVLAFVDAQEKDFLNDSDREVLTAVKCALFSRAGGIPYQRDAR